MVNNEEELNKINSLNEERNNSINIDNNKKITKNINKDINILKNIRKNKNFNTSIKHSRDYMLENEKNSNNNKNKSNIKLKKKYSKKNSIENIFDEEKNINNNNNNNSNDNNLFRRNTSLTVLQRTKELDTTDFKIFPLWFGILCAFINLCLPGIGTIIGIIRMNDKSTKKSFACSGICQFFTSFFIVGWFYALCNSCLYILAGKYGKSFEEYMISDK
jgi:hypothetical protein